MRPAILFPLFAPIASLKGVGPRMAGFYKKLCGEHIADLLWHLPTGVIDRAYAPKLAEAETGRIATLTLKVVEHSPPRKKSLPYRIIATDGEEQLSINYFNAKGDYLSNLYPPGKEVVVSGKLEMFHGHWSMSHPDYALPPSRRDEIPRLEPVYPMTEGLGGKMLRKTVQQALEKTPELPEWNDPHLLAREKWPAWREALRIAHNPKSPLPRIAGEGGARPAKLRSSEAGWEGEGAGDETGARLQAPSPRIEFGAGSNPLSAYAKASADESAQPLRSFSEGGPQTGEGYTARRRLAYDELLADQLALAVIRRHHRQGGGRALAGGGDLQKNLLASLPFKLTPGQTQASAEISGDMSAPRRMLRLLQGDVGSGKTIVALLAMLQATEAGTQAALMAPTEILARQHHDRLTQFLKPLGIEIGLVLGKSRGDKSRSATLARLADGSLSLTVGTHALFQDDVAFRDLGLAVIDEQHRFGVNQRLQLSDKGRGVDILVMTATPIPRTLTLTAYGDMDVSRLTGKPPGRQPIDTRLIDMSRTDDVIDGLRRKIASGAQAYWVCPLVEESEEIDLTAATTRAKTLAAQLGADKVGLIHGRMNGDEKERMMSAFLRGEIKILVATTVIEVGVDVPNATLMIVEHAERFGLAPLHQLRGRVGRGAAQSNCLLLYQGPLGEMAQARLKLLRETEDGFRIAEEDLKLRGSGELLGTRQSGIPEFRLADLARDADLLHIASDDAKLILTRDPELQSERGKALRILLYLFARDAAVPLLRAG